MDYTRKELLEWADRLEAVHGSNTMSRAYRAHAAKIEECERVKRGLSAARAVIRYLVDHSGRHLPKHQAAINAALKETK